MTNQVEQDFLVAYIAETIRLEMDGPAHRIARSNGLENRDFGKLIAQRLQVQRDFMDGKLKEPIDEQIQWPWPDKTGAEVIESISASHQNCEIVKGKLK